jgi:hypothetical protein
LEQTALFEEFKELFESRLETFLNSLGVSVDRLIDRCSGMLNISWLLLLLLLLLLLFF